jgi:6,7-dimethyl-8-ribityllumazine synthase
MIPYHNEKTKYVESRKTHLNIILYVDSFEKQIVDSFLTDVILKIKGLDVDMDSVKITSIPGKTRNDISCLVFTTNFMELLFYFLLCCC